MFTQIKSYLSNDTIFYTLLILVVALGAFGLGRLSVAEKATVMAQNKDIERQDVVPTVGVKSVATSSTSSSSTELLPIATSSKTTEQGEFVASRKGTKYHYTWCPGAAQIKPENKLFFVSAAAARAAGYTPASNCPGLE